ncbi:hypothetical protein D3C81_2028150 [compost metagenome]
MEAGYTTTVNRIKPMPSFATPRANAVRWMKYKAKTRSTLDSTRPMVCRLQGRTYDNPLTIMGYSGKNTQLAGG